LIHTRLDTDIISLLDLASRTKLIGHLDGASMILYKKLECNNLSQINDEILQYIHKKKFDSRKFWNPVDTIEFLKATPKFKIWWSNNQLPIKSVAITQGLSDDCCGPHTDTPPSRYKLSWPVLNTERTWNRWFLSDPDCQTQVNYLGGITYLNYNQLQEIGRMQVDQPAIIATGVPHDVWCEPNAVFPRWGLQCQLFIEPTSL